MYIYMYARVRYRYNNKKGDWGGWFDCKLFSLLHSRAFEIYVALIKV